MNGNKNRQLTQGNGASNGYGLSASSERTSPEVDGTLDFSELWTTVKRGKWFILATTVVVVAAMTVWTLTLTPEYQSSSIVAVSSDDSPTDVGIYSVAARRGMAAEVGTLQNSEEIASKVIERLRQRAEASGATDYPVLFDADGSERDEMEIASDLREMTTFRGREEQQMIEINVTSEHPEEAATIANLFAEVYQEYDIESSRASIRAAREFLEGQLERREEELRDLEEQWANYAQQQQMPTQGQDGQRLVNQYVEMEGRRDELEFQLEEEEASLEMLRRQKEQYEPGLRDEIRDDYQTEALENEVNSLQQRIADLNTEAMEYYMNNPDLEGDRERIREEFPALEQILRSKEELERRKEEKMEEVVERRRARAETGASTDRVAELRNQIRERELRINGIRAQLAGVSSVIENQRGMLHNIPHEQVEREQLERRVNQAERFYNMFMEDLQQTIVAEESELGSVRLVRQATVPNVPVYPNVQQNIILGLLLGLGFGVGLAFLRQAADNRFQKPDQINVDGHSLVGVIPRMDREIEASFDGEKTVEVEGRQVSTNLLPMLNPWSPISENYRLVRTNLKHGNDGAPPQLLLMTSPQMSDGKTVTCVNLAITIAQSGLRTLLIDADLRRPAAHKMMDLPLEPGLAEVLMEDHEWVQVVQKTEVAGLHFMSAGRSEQPPAEALESVKMKDLLGQVRDMYDVILIDSPPVLAVSDPVLLSTQCDATLVVVSADKTDQRALDTTRKTIESVGGQIGGVIFNQYDDSDADVYGYGYSYGYGSEYRQKYTEA